VKLITALVEHPEMDAVCGVQMKRETDCPLNVLEDENGEMRKLVPLTEFKTEFTKAAMAHFGLTAFRASKFEAMEKPWFLAQPSPDGRWGEGRRDEDINFWYKWKDAGNSLYIANDVRLGHIQRMVTWPGPCLKPVHQYLHDYNHEGKPEGVTR